jgi:hypothetical protein
MEEVGIDPFHNSCPVEILEVETTEVGRSFILLESEYLSDFL